MTILHELEVEFSNAIANRALDSVERILTKFDTVCRRLVEQEIDLNKKKKIIKTCMQTHDNWQVEIIKLKAKVKGELADIKSNGKKIQKYLTSY